MRLGLRRSKLFTPGNRPELMTKAAKSAADMVVLDLEDAVPEAEKAAAREQVRTALGALDFQSKERGVRINGIDTPHWLDDLMTTYAPELDAIHIPKVNGPREIWVVEAVLDDLERKAGSTRRVLLIPTLETPDGIANARAIATASGRIGALQFGLGDLKVELGLAPTPHRLAWFRTQVVMAAHAGRVPALDTVFFDFKDELGYRADAEEARGLGFSGKSCIHPAQVPLANEIFAPTEREVAWARRVLHAYEAGLGQGLGAVALEGIMIDRPVAEQARKIMLMASERKEGS